MSHSTVDIVDIQLFGNPVVMEHKFGRTDHPARKIRVRRAQIPAPVHPVVFEKALYRPGNYFSDGIHRLETAAFRALSPIPRAGFHGRGRRSERRYNLRMSSERAKAQKIFFLLRQRYGEPAWDPKPPVDELISTVLSQNTNDANRDKAFTALRAKFPRWEDVLERPAAEVVDAIRPAGLGPQKGPRIRSILQTIQETRGRIELDFLRGRPPSETREWLRQLPGVGPKTAAIVMLFALDLPAFPVDTHVYRVTGRLGLRAANLTVEAAHEHLAMLFSPEQYAAAHLNLIRLGREVCHARKPECPGCPLRRTCAYYRKLNAAPRKP